MRCTSKEDGLAAMKMLQNCDQFEVSHVYLYFKEADAEFWSTLLGLLKKYPVKTLQIRQASSSHNQSSLVLVSDCETSAATL